MRYPGLLGVLVLLACTPASPPSTEPAAEALRAQLEAYYADFSARDWVAFADHFWPGATIATAWQPLGEDRARVVPTTVEDFVAEAPNGPGSRAIFEEWMDDVTISVWGNVAHAWVNFGARFGDPGDVDEWHGVDSISLLRVDDEWRIASLVFASEN